MKQNILPTAAPSASPRRFLKRRLRFETLLADLSARFVNLPVSAP